MIKKIFLYTSIASVIFLIGFLTENYLYNRDAVKNMILSLGYFKLEQNTKIINAYLSDIEDITKLIAQSPFIPQTFPTPEKETKNNIEDMLLKFANSVNLIEFIRLVDINNNIIIFVKKGEITSRLEDYTPINLSVKEYFDRISKLGTSNVSFSNFELQRLPTQTFYGNPVIRTMVSLFQDDQKIGYLVINFNASFLKTLSDTVNENVEDISLLELNEAIPERNGIFISNKNKNIEFADQKGSEYYFQKMYGVDVFREVTSKEFGYTKINNGKDFLFFSKIHTLKNESTLLLLITLKGDYYFSDLKIIKINIAISIFIALVIMLSSAYMVKRKLIKPMENIIHAMETIANHNFKYRLQGEFPEEWRAVAKTVNFMNESIEKFINDNNNQQQKIEKLNRLSDLGIMAGGIAHELNSPLNSIIILAALLKENADKNSIKDIEIIENQAKRCSQTIRSLRALSADTTKNYTEKVDLKQIVDEVINEVKHQNIPIIAPEKYYNIQGESNLIFTVIKNLVQNALEAVNVHGIIKISVEKVEKLVIVKVSDNGCGMEQHIVENIPQPFSSSKTKGSNIGLGLAIVYKIMDDLDAKISVSSKICEGTTFILEFKHYG